MALIETNPFQELYVTDSPDPRTFVQLFSELPVSHALAMFRPGNVVLKGTQGSGKSMLLNLLRPQIRLAYDKAGAKFPIPGSLRSFIGAGINLTLSGALDIGQRPLSENAAEDEAAFPLYFADFLNYYIVRDLLRSVIVANANPEAFEGLVHGARFDVFADAVSRDACWFEAFAASASIEALIRQIDQRLAAYRAFHVFNVEQLPAEIERTKTALGEPISRSAELLRQTGVLPGNTPVFIRIDQIERLYRSDQLRPTLGWQYRRIINKALGSRDSRVSYRIGTRRYAWEDDLRIFGTDDQLEHIRDFRVIDLDEILRRKEDTKTWVFPDFAEDALIRRLRYAGYHNIPAGDVIKRVFGSTVDPRTAARDYARNSSAERVLKLDDFPHNWTSYLRDLFREDPLTATLAAAWARQRGSTSHDGPRYAEAPPKPPGPWERPYWKKERVRQCILQIAARSVQRLKWAGKDQVLMLSAGNISIFLSICHEIWEAFLRAERRKPPHEQGDPTAEPIHPDVQAVGIRSASRYWYEKITEQPKGDDRQRFINVLGAEFRSRLLNDDSMSYPGHNGFSLAIDELSAFPPLAAFLEESVSYGDLYSVSHTTKERDRRQRRKWYLNPVLADYFQIPESHAKEPAYVSVGDVLVWLQRAEVWLGGVEISTREDREGQQKTTRSRGHDHNHPLLFGNDNGGGA